MGPRNTRVNEVLKCIQGGAEQLALVDNSIKKLLDIYLILWSIINQKVYSILLKHLINESGSRAIDLVL